MDPMTPSANPDAARHVALCVSFCETADPRAGFQELLELLSATCQDAGFPHCERVYVGSYFCENYFLGLTDEFHQAVRALCATFDMGATLVVPIVGQAFLQRVDDRLDDLMQRFGDVYDELVANDVAEYLYLAQRFGRRVGLGRLFSKEQRDARYADLRERSCTLELSAEARECLDAAVPHRPLVECDPVAAVVDASAIMAASPEAEIAIHLPFCYATTGRNCGPASTFEPDSEKFRLGRGCGRHCLRMAQGVRTQEGVDYVKHGRTYYFRNPGCAIAGTSSWRVVYAAAHETMNA